ncbi:hypothetical protein C8E95_4882 [Pseudonocardia autotrophica]|jgi:hypothetical protein|uniref:Uncharacterized protein n=1 Tax=Pseudonocardia autotrophica TaxID=2074 RepID=A0A1L8QA82_PSEAH|nr:hypothetical protein BG618_04289 [Pseudonocardia autotrophica]OSY35688.1 hypothetical protein BG845_05899 [Pseudonocardia autotrophica]TDN75702.1 hypothetical protein C8E95_4882 [Pseudonocardia autotrophica]
MSLSLRRWMSTYRNVCSIRLVIREQRAILKTAF